VLGVRQRRQQLDRPVGDVEHREPELSGIEVLGRGESLGDEAMRVPSGDQAGCKSAGRSFVQRRTARNELEGEHVVCPCEREKARLRPSGTRTASDLTDAADQ
jgi:hypothetical protein